MQTAMKVLWNKATAPKKRASKQKRTKQEVAPVQPNTPDEVARLGTEPAAKQPSSIWAR